ncbi:MAG: hypothetical protein AB9835_05035 [Eubacteriales bacterium]
MKTPEHICEYILAVIGVATSMYRLVQCLFAIGWAIGTAAI